MDVSFKGNLGTVFTPTADPVFSKGDQWLNVLSAGVLWVAATRPDSNRPFASTASELGGANIVDRIEFYLVGTKVRNARFVTVRRDVVDL